MLRLLILLKVMMMVATFVLGRYSGDYYDVHGAAATVSSSDDKSRVLHT